MKWRVKMKQKTGAVGYRGRVHVVEVVAESREAAGKAALKSSNLGCYFKVDEIREVR